MEKLKAYIQKAFGAKFDVVPYETTNSLPYLLLGNYEFYLASFNRRKFIIMEDRKRTKLTPHAIFKHLELASSYLKMSCVYVTDKMKSYNRNRLVVQHAPFVIPERQLYLPFLGAAFSEAGSKSPKEFNHLGVLAQLLIIGQLNRIFSEAPTIAMLQAKFDYTRFSVMKAFDELEYFQLAERREIPCKLVFLKNGKELLETALPLLKNPCRRTIGLDALPEHLPVCVAGGNALEKISMLSALPHQKEYAVEVGAVINRKDIVAVPKDAAPVLLQLWTYRPTIIGGDTVDPVSLYLTLKDDSDDRVQIELDKLLSEILW